MKEGGWQSCVCDKVVCEQVVCERERRRRRSGIQNPKQEPHTKMWGKTRTPHTKMWGKVACDKLCGGGGGGGGGGREEERTGYRNENKNPTQRRGEKECERTNPFHRSVSMRPSLSPACSTQAPCKEQTIDYVSYHKKEIFSCICMPALISETLNVPGCTHDGAFQLPDVSGFLMQAILHSYG